MGPMALPPGFRFHPTDEELVAYYLHRKINGGCIELDLIPDVDLYKYEPWDLPEMSFLPGKDSEWYFYSPRGQKYPNGSRTNRATKSGYWKATGKDRIVRSGKRTVGMKKTLVFYEGRAPNGVRSNWVMHEYRLIEPSSFSSNLDSYALCRVFKKNNVVTKTICSAVDRILSDAGKTPENSPDPIEEENAVTNCDKNSSDESSLDTTFVEDCNGRRLFLCSNDIPRFETMDEYEFGFLGFEGIFYDTK